MLLRPQVGHCHIVLTVLGYNNPRTPFHNYVDSSLTDYYTLGGIEKLLSEYKKN